MENFIQKLRKLNIDVDVVDDQLKLQIPELLDATEIIQEVRSNKEALIAFIQKAKTNTKYETLPRAAKKPRYVSSAAQRRLYFLAEFDKESLAYNMPQAIRMTGKLDRQKIRGAFNELLARHEILRTSFEFEDGQVVQRVSPILTLDMEETLCTKEEVDRILKEFIRPFDLSESPLLRVKLLAINEAEHYLLVDIHHIITDGVSHGILMSDFMSLYKGEKLPALEFHYKDYAEWQQGEAQQQKLAKHKQFWLQEFAEQPNVLELPYDFERPLQISYEGGILNLEFTPEITAKLKALAASEKTTLFTVVLSAFYILLHKLSGQEDMVVGTPISGREHPDLENTMGIFINTLPLRMFPKGSLTYAQFLNEVKSRLLSCFDHQLFQYEDLIEALQVVRNTSRNPLFDVMFSYENFTEPTFQIPGLVLERHFTGRRTAKFDLILTTVETDDSLLLAVEYATSIFKEETIARFIACFKKIVAAILENKNIAIADIEVLSSEEKEKVIRTFNATKTEYPQEKTIVDFFKSQVHKTPDNTALRFREQTMTYAALDELSGKVASYLIEKKGVKSGDLVGLMLEREWYLIPAIFGILKAGAAYVPIDPHFPAERIKSIITDAQLKFLITRGKHVEAKNDGNLSLIDLDECLEIILAGTALKEELTFSSSQLAYVIYTSGSTGTPKGVMIEHHSVINRIGWMQKMYPITAKDVLLQKTPIVFDVSVWELFWWSFTGASLTLLPPGAEKSPEEIIDVIARDQVTTLHFVPSMLSVFLMTLDQYFDYSNLRSIRQVFASGEALKKDQVVQFGRTFNQYCGSRLINLYGPTEATVDVSYYECNFEAIPNDIPIGQPIDNTELYILDRYNRPVPIGTKGELHIAGVGLARGYLNNEELTNQKFIANPFATGKKIYKTGDLARWLPNGDIDYLGRIDNQVKIRGFRIELGEIESRLLTHDEILEAVVLAKDHGGEKELVAYYVAKDAIEVSTLRAYLSVNLAEYMIPSFYIHLHAMPLTVNGKLDRKALPEIELKAGPDYQAPSNELEETLTEIWAEVLKLDKTTISVNKNFFELGGTSLKILKVKNIIFERLGIQIDLTDFFRHNTIEKLANFIGKEEWLMFNVEGQTGHDDDEIFID